MSRMEWKRICDHLGYVPQPRDDLKCPMLNEQGKCSVYAIRPLVCRLFGVVHKMPCPHVQPKEWMSEEDELRVLMGVSKLGY